MIWVSNAHAPCFRSGWFVESLATRSLVIFAIRTRRVRLFRSRSKQATDRHYPRRGRGRHAGPFSAAAHALGFTALPAALVGCLVAMVITYLVLIELRKQFLYRALPQAKPETRPFGATLRVLPCSPVALAPRD